MLAVGQIIDGKYKILEQIGQGGMSHVYLAIHEKVNKTWAIKEVAKDGLENYEILKKLHHSSLPSVVDVIEEDESILIVMDYIEGITLNKILKKEGVIPQERVMEWARQLCEVLEYLHSKNIIYRDLKPSNIILRPNGTIAVIDFGTAREFKGYKIEDTTCLGTKGYAAPEQYGGKGETDARTDIYSLGVTLYHLVTGHNPSKPPYEMKPIRQWNRQLSTGLESIIIKCTKNNPNERYQSCEEMLYDLNNINRLDYSYRLKQKIKMASFIGSSVLTLILGFTTIFAYANSLTLMTKQYESLIKETEEHFLINQEILFDKFARAIELNSSKSKAYEKMLEFVLADNLITSKEDIRINQIMGSFGEDYKTSNPKSYSKFAYKLGQGYWFFYENSSNRETLAARWFGNLVEKDSEEQWIRRAKIFVGLEEINRGLLTISTNPTGEGKTYKDYFNQMKKLLEAFVPVGDGVEDADRIATLDLYLNTISKIRGNLSVSFKEAGITKTEMLKVLDEIENYTKKMGNGNNSNILSKRQWLLGGDGAIESARVTVKTIYEGRE